MKSIRSIIASQSSEITSALLLLSAGLEYFTNTSNTKAYNYLVGKIELSRKGTNRSFRGKSVHKIFFTGVGKNKSIASKTANTFRSLNFTAHEMCPMDAMHGDLGMIENGDTIIALSKSGNTDELVHMLKYVKNRLDVNIVGVQIGDEMSDLSDNCDKVFYLPEIKETNSLNAPTNSIILTQLFFDAIATFLSQDLTKDEFIRNHPGGTLGEGNDDI